MTCPATVSHNLASRAQAAGEEPDAQAYSALIGAAYLGGDVALAMRALKQAARGGVELDGRVIEPVLKAWKARQESKPDNPGLDWWTASMVDQVRSTERAQSPLYVVAVSATPALTRRRERRHS